MAKTGSSESSRKEKIFSVGAIKGNDVIVQPTMICARDSQHALVKASALVSAIDEDAGASNIRYVVSELRDTQGAGQEF